MSWLENVIVYREEDLLVDSKLPRGVSVTLRDHLGVGEGKPAAPAAHRNVTHLSLRSPGVSQTWDSHPALLVLAVVPAVAGLRNQQGDDVALGEAEQRAVIARCVREDGLDPGSSVPLQTCSHGAGAGQSPGLHWKQEVERLSSCKWL